MEPRFTRERVDRSGRAFMARRIRVTTASVAFVAALGAGSIGIVAAREVPGTNKAVASTATSTTAPATTGSPGSAASSNTTTTTVAPSSTSSASTTISGAS